MKVTVEPRAKLTRDRVLETALALADTDGIEALTMRRLGQTLGVEAMSLYNHVSNKDDIVERIVDLVVGEFEVPATELGWKDGVHGAAVSANRALVRHPWASGVLMSRDLSPGPSRLRWMDSILCAFRDGGFSVELTHHAFHALEIHIFGYTHQQVSFPYDAKELQNVGADFLQQLPVDDYPHLAEHVVGHLEGSFAEGGGFEFGLGLILDGLERIKDPV